jgi:predicted aspartyl protease
MLISISSMTTTAPQPTPLPSDRRDKPSSPSFRLLQRGLLIAQVVSIVWIISAMKFHPDKSWTPDTSSVTETPPHKLTVTNCGHPAVVNLISNPVFLPELELTINGKPARFLVDTGSTHVCLLGNAMETLGLRADAEFDADIGTAHGRKIIRTGYVKSATFGIGNGTTVQMENVLVIADDVEASHQGLLSGAFLNAIGGVIDLRAGTVRLGGCENIHEPRDDAKPTPNVPHQAN